MGVGAGSRAGIQPWFGAWLEAGAPSGLGGAVRAWGLRPCLGLQSGVGAQLGLQERSTGNGGLMHNSIYLSRFWALEGRDCGRGNGPHSAASRCFRAACRRRRRGREPPGLLLPGRSSHPQGWTLVT